MKPGSPGFVGDRLRGAREARGLTAISLAEIVSVSRQAISQYERGDGTPRPDVLERLASTLNLPPRFFFLSTDATEGGPVFFRSLSAATKAARAKAVRRLEWVRRIRDHVEHFVDLPAVELPDLSVTGDPLALTDEQIESLAVDAREHWRLGNAPVSNMVWLLENAGVVVARGDLEAEKLDAFSQWSPSAGRPVVFLTAGKHAATRSRLDAAHELGHLLLHRSVDPKRIGNPIVHKVIERHAFRFGAALLLPPRAFARDFYAANLDVLRNLKSRWGASIGMMLMRAAQLEYIPEEQASRLWMQYGRRGWKQREPLDDSLEIERPALLRRAIELVLDQRLQTPAELLDDLCLPPTDVEDLAALPRGRLSTSGRRELGPPTVRSRPPGGGGRTGGPGKVLPMRRGR